MQLVMAFLRWLWLKFYERERTRVLCKYDLLDKLMGGTRSMFGMLLRVVVSIKQLKWTLWYCVDFNKLLQLYTFISLDFVIHIGWVPFFIASNKKVSFIHSSNFEPLSKAIFFQNMLFCQPNFPPEETNEMSIAISARTFQNVALFNRLSPVRCAEHKTRCEASYRVGKFE